MESEIYSPFLKPLLEEDEKRGGGGGCEGKNTSDWKLITGSWKEAAEKEKEKENSVQLVDLSFWQL